jgi:hypothetical protein
MVSEIERLSDDLLRELRDQGKDKSKEAQAIIKLLTEINENIKGYG